MNPAHFRSATARLLAIGTLVWLPQAQAQTNGTIGSCISSPCTGPITPAQASVKVTINQGVPVRTVQLIGLPSFEFRPASTLATLAAVPIAERNRYNTPGEQSSFCVQSNYSGTIQIQVTSPNVTGPAGDYSFAGFSAASPFTATAPGRPPLPMGVSIRPKGANLTEASVPNRWSFPMVGSPDCNNNPSDQSVVWVDVELMNVPQDGATYSATLNVSATPQ